ncbi:MAG: winged helix-turn-helix domain-containing protein [Gammaproteobacteria bacterium]|nr:winged helix-turn-helix domain-containing protein [Gammaproteobacteria bacterium]MDH5303706.1 winged helix-turn-helix domain-containing protein [Gammaproteobacteria bacterium]MDH5322675.1 winged helix-turn-helix domain-containing protein [Gammaproteobacteria bacterium]
MGLNPGRRRRSGGTATNSQLLAHVWGADAIVGPRTVDVHIRRLRNLLEPYSYAKYIQ